MVIDRVNTANCINEEVADIALQAAVNTPVLALFVNPVGAFGVRFAARAGSVSRISGIVVVVALDTVTRIASEGVAIPCGHAQRVFAGWSAVVWGVINDDHVIFVVAARQVVG